MHYEDKKTGFKFDAVIGLPKENTAEAFEELFAANKATEEGELPLDLMKQVIRDALGNTHIEDGTVAAFDQVVDELAIAVVEADRASRQGSSVPDCFANKADVEPVTAAYVNFETLDCVIGFGGDHVPEGYWPVATIPFAATPATTGCAEARHTGGANATPTGCTDAPHSGASTARDQALEEAANHAECIGTDWLDANDTHKNFAADYIAKSIRALKGSVGASTAFIPTVLTGELIDAIMAKYSAFIAPGVYSLNSFECVEDVRSFAREVAAQAGQVAVPEWISVDERLPDAGHCLATYRNQHGKLRIIRAKYARQFEIDAGEDAIDQGNCEYNEADDTFYLKAGWLECIDNWDDYSSIYVTEGEVTHWMPLPDAPSPAKESK